MTGLTAELGLATATDSDDIEIYNVVNLAAALVLLDALFSNSAGHDHSGAHLGKAIPATALAQPLALTSPTLTSPVLNGPSITAAIISSGGLTVNAGGVTIVTGNLTLGVSSVATLAGGLIANADCVIGVGGLGPSAVSGFAWLSAGGGGAPVGVPANLSATGFTNTIPTTVDVANKRIYCYVGGGWHYTQLT